MLIEHRKDNAAKKAENHTQATRTENSEHTFAFNMTDGSSECGRNVLNSNLLVDTGATSHIVSDPSKLVSFDKGFDASTHIKVNAAVGEGGCISLDKQNKHFKSSDGAAFNIKQVGRLYYLNSISCSKNNASTLLEWHKILGHCNFSDNKKL